MITRFSSLEEFAEALSKTKFNAVGVPYDWTFGGQAQFVKDKDGQPEALMILGRKFRIVGDIPEQRMWVISTQ
jgi:hypothetical protein